MTGIVIVVLVVALAIGTVLGFLAGLVKARRIADELRSRAATLQIQFDSAEAGRRQALADMEQLRGQSADAIERVRKEGQAECERIRTQSAADIDKARQEVRREDAEHYENLRKELDTRHSEALEALNKRFNETIALMKEEVQNSTRSLLEERQKEFTANSSESLNRIMQPLQDNIRQMQETVKENTVRNTDFSGQLKAGIENVLKQSQAAMASADRLANALSVGNKVQGNWGERILTELLEATGMIEGIHFTTQEFIRDENGTRVKSDDEKGLQPDVILNIDKSHHVVIDSKVSLTAFFKYKDAETPEEQDRFLAEHISSLKNHVKELVRKDYASHLKGALDYVIMFVPITQALYAATLKDPSLWRDAMENKVYIADEQTLFAALKIISLNWRQQAQAENHAEVYRLANEMLNRVGMFVERLQGVGKSLHSAQDSYDQAFQKLTTGNQALVKTCDKLIRLGAKYEKKNGPLTPLLSESEPE